MNDECMRKCISMYLCVRMYLTVLYLSVLCKCIFDEHKDHPMVFIDTSQPVDEVMARRSLPDTVFHTCFPFSFVLSSNTSLEYQISIVYFELPFVLHNLFLQDTKDPSNRNITSITCKSISEWL